MKKFVKLLVAALAAVVLLQVPVSAQPITPAYQLHEVSTDVNKTSDLIAAIAKALESSKKSASQEQLNKTVCQVNALLSENTLKGYQNAYAAALASEQSALLYYNELVNLSTYKVHKQANRQDYMENVAKIIVKAPNANYGVAPGEWVLTTMKNRIDVVAKEVAAAQAQLDAITDIKGQVAVLVNVTLTDSVGISEYLKELQKLETHYTAVRDAKADELSDLQDQALATKPLIDAVIASDQAETFKTLFETVTANAKQAYVDAVKAKDAALLKLSTYTPLHNILVAKCPVKPAEQKVEKPADKDNAKAAATEKLPSTGAVR